LIFDVDNSQANKSLAEKSSDCAAILNHPIAVSCFSAGTHSLTSPNELMLFVLECIRWQLLH